MSWEPNWPDAVILTGNALDALSILSLHPVPATRKDCVVVSAGAVTASIPKWIEVWNPRQFFCAYDDSRSGDHAVRRLIRKDTVASHTRSSIPSPTNHRNRRLNSSCSISCRSERIEWNA